MTKEKIISLIEGFTIELNPKVRHKLKYIPLNKKNNVFVSYIILMHVLQANISMAKT